MIKWGSIRSIANGDIFSLDLIESRPGFISLEITGKGAYQDFKNESGGHRFQRIPPTETKGRRHTSTITVAELRAPDNSEVQLDPTKLKIKTCRGSGAGGQHRNKTDSAVHIQYGDMDVRCESERSQHQNKATAMNMLRARLLEAQTVSVSQTVNKKRKNQVGSGMRGDKIRTLRVQDNLVKDHRTGKKMRYEKYCKGYLEELH